MKDNNSSTIKHFILWLIIVPPGIYYTFVYFPHAQVNWSYLIGFAILGFLTVYFPVKRNGSPLFLVMWLTLPAFLMYGLFVEIVIMQIAILGVLFSAASRAVLARRFFFNSTLFFIVSVIAAYVFHKVGGEIGSFHFWPVVFGVFAYQLTHTIVNDALLRAYARYKKIKTFYTWKESLMDYAIVLVVIPLSLSLYFLIDYIGMGAFLLLGIPFFFIALIVRLYNNTEKINEYLQDAGDIGYEISNKMTEQEVIDQFVSKVSTIFEADFAYLFDNQDDWLELIRSYEHDQFLDITSGKVVMGQGLARIAYEKNKPLVYATREEWMMVAHQYIPDELQSVLCVPITRNQKIEGVLLLGSRKKSAFEEYQLKILDLLCSYFTVSVEKARYMQEAVTKVERCALTGLYNYKYLEGKLSFEIEQLKNKMYKDLSVVMLDIDHFKQVNDTYGHQSGNDILCELAKLLEATLPKDGIVGRYGGEEFVYILPGKSKDKAIDFAEELRVAIAGHGFSIISDLDDEKKQLAVHITASMGVASAPEDTDEAMTLLRNADRALYIGAKQAGRNRVAEYVK